MFEIQNWLNESFTYYGKLFTDFFFGCSCQALKLSAKLAL